jgi:hypothetical protein
MYKSTTPGPGQGLSRFKNPQPPAGDPKREPSKPAPPRRDPYVAAAAGQRVVVALKGGLVLEGLLSPDSPPGLLRLQAVRVKAREREYSTAWILIERTAVSHLHPVPTETGAT